VRSALRSPWAWAAVALAVRLAYVLAGPGLDATPWSDSVDYHRLAAHLASGRGFTLGPDDALYPTTFRPPLVPALVAPVYALFGPRYGLALVLQALLGALVVPVAAALARKVARDAGRSERFITAAAALTAAAVALWPPLVYFTGALLTETTASLLVTFALLHALRLRTAGGAWSAFGLGAVLALAALARPTALPLAAALFAWLALAGPRPRGVRVRDVGLAFLSFALVLAPWTARNRAVTGAWIPLTSGGGAALWDGNNPLVAGDPRWRGGAVSLREVEPWALEFAAMDELAIDRHAGARARAFMAEDPARTARMAGWKLARFFRVTRETTVSGEAGPTGSARAQLARAIDPLAVTWGLLLPFCVAALGWALAHPGRAACAPALAVVVQAALAAVYWGSLRFRAPVEPALVVLGVYGLLGALAMVSGRRRRS
jgi:hypothetical protein